MRRNFLTGLIICLIPTALAATFVGMAISKEYSDQTGFRRGIDLAGGTILVYEVDLERSKARGTAEEVVDGQSGLTSEQIQKLAENLKRRIDPNDLKNVVVRPVGTTRVEIILPFAGSTSGTKQAANEDFVREVRSLVAQTGVLEFRILANAHDDEPGLRAAEAVIAQADSDPKLKERMAFLAKEGLPPPGPEQDFTVEVNGNTQDNVSYEWVELGPEERTTLNLDNAAAEDPARNQLWRDLAERRGKTFRRTQPAGEEGTGGITSMLLYSRDFVKRAPSKDEEDKKVEYFLLTRVSATDTLKVDRDAGLTARVDDMNLTPVVSFGFGPSGAARFGQMTERNKPGKDNFYRCLAIVMDGKIVSAPSLNAVLRDRGQISGKSFDLDGVKRLVHILRSGALNAELKPEPVSENTVGPTLGQDTIMKGMWAVGLSFGAVMLFMVIYYKFAGGIACLALLMNLLITVGFMIAVQAAFTLPGLAGIVLMLGMAVDANVLIFERMREERDKGANLQSAIRLGYDRAFPTIIDTHLTSIFTAIVLYIFGNDNLKGFAVSLTLGLVISLFTALYMTRLIFDYWMHKRWMTSFNPHLLFARPSFDFMKIRVPVFTATALVTLAGFLLFIGRGEAGLNVDFTKGTAYGGRLKEPRGLSESGGKFGLLDLLDGSRQDKQLGVKEVVWLGKPDDSDDPDAPHKQLSWIYKITFQDNSDAIVTLANAPEGTDEAAQKANVAERVSKLPGYSVEQVKLSGVDDNLPYAESKSFLVRTTEKEADLVQVMLDRLLRDEKTNEPLLDATSIVERKVTGPIAVLTFDKPTSPGYLRSFLMRELKLAGRVPLINTPPVMVTGIPTDSDPALAKEEASSGRYTKIQVDVANNPEFKNLADAGKPGSDPKKVELDQQAFNRILDDALKSFVSRPLPDRLETFDPALAADTRNRAVFAILLSWVAILMYLWFRFGSWTFGLAAVLCLMHDLFFTLGAIALSHYVHDTMIGQMLRLQDFKIDLPCVAALLTLIGFSVNDTIVVFDRIKEVRGKNPLLTPQMINDSINQTLSRTVLASLTVFLVVGVLYWFGGEGVHLFSFVMVVGVIVGTFSSIYVASPLLLILGEGAPKPGERVAAPVTQSAELTA